MEQEEILDYRTVYYLGLPVHKKMRSSIRLEPNFGFDDDRGDYKISFHDHIGFRYEIIEFLGKGSFGQVVKTFDHKKKIYVAMKLIRN